MADHLPVPPASILIVAAECKGLAKVGGLADVVHDLTAELRRQGQKVRLLLPGYELISASGEDVLSTNIAFAGETYSVVVETVSLGGFEADLIRCPEFFGRHYESVYVDSAARGGGPFEDDAARFAFFSTAVAHLLIAENRYQGIEVLHCHDWHMGTLLLLARLSQRFEALRQLPILFTIHNLDYQGQRPFCAPTAPRTSSLEGWFPQEFGELSQPHNLSMLRDPVAEGCYNPMRTAIELADYVNTVSPNYAREITLRDDADRSFVGGRGLEGLLSNRDRDGTLVGLLNGIDYEEFDPRRLTPPFSPASPDWQDSKGMHKEKLRRLLASPPMAAAPDISGGLLELRSGKQFAKLPLVVAVTRLAGQKVSLLFEKTDRGCALDSLAALSANFVILGTGEYGSRLHDALEGRSGNILHIGRFDQGLADLVYAAGDYFLMPSDFEPCGISQMIAMRYGTLPIVTPVGGLADTVEDGINGYHVSIRGGRREVARTLVETVATAVANYGEQAARYKAMQLAAMNARFTWDDSAAEYTKLYEKLKRGPCTSPRQSGMKTSQD